MSNIHVIAAFCLSVSVYMITRLLPDYQIQQHSAHKRTTEATMDDPCYDRAKGSVVSTLALWGDRSLERQSYGGAAGFSFEALSRCTRVLG